MKFLLTLLLWTLLLVFCWPLALLILVAWPILAKTQGAIEASPNVGSHAARIGVATTHTPAATASIVNDGARMRSFSTSHTA